MAADITSLSGTPLTTGGCVQRCQRCSPLAAKNTAADIIELASSFSCFFPPKRKPTTDALTRRVFSPISSFLRRRYATTQRRRIEMTRNGCGNAINEPSSVINRRRERASSGDGDTSTHSRRLIRGAPVARHRRAKTARNARIRRSEYATRTFITGISIILDLAVERRELRLRLILARCVTRIYFHAENLEIRVSATGR